MAGRVPRIQDVNPVGTVITRREKEDQSDPLPFRRQAFPESLQNPGRFNSSMDLATIQARPSRNQMMRARLVPLGRVGFRLPA
jgi:hypothetical protein